MGAAGGYCSTNGPQQPGCSRWLLFQAIRNGLLLHGPLEIPATRARTCPKPDQPAWALRWFTPKL